ncbi:unnamed protein product [Arctia plantaginis]|uniref:Uncharacterized protein n=1 Tax=Arctia plantaginis TaxID=874455 RepID=A0A8S1BBC1_ARCPL|nr:unnamed protein product [Arctia plantaginis]
MPKFTLFHLCVVAASLYIVSAVTEEEIKAFRKAIRPIIETCSEEYGVVSGDVQTAKDNKDANAVKPCFTECVLRKIGILDTNGYYDAERGLHGLRKFVKNDEDFAKFQVVAMKCTKVNDIPVSKDETRCDRAMLVLGCGFDNIAEMPLK